MASLTGLPDGLDGLAARQARVLVEQLRGANLCDPLRLREAIGNDIDSFLISVFGVEVVEEGLFLKLTDFQETISKAAKWEEASRYGGGDPRLLDHLEVLRARKRKDAETKGLPAPNPDELWTPRGGPAKKRRLSSGRRNFGEKESSDHRRWCLRFARILEDAQGPAWQDAVQSGDPLKFLIGLAGGARLGTIKTRVRAWERMARWLRICKGRSWPASVVDVIEYAWAQFDEAPSVSFARGLGGALNWIETRSGVPVSQRLSSSDLLKRSFDQMTAEVEAQTGARRKAPRVPIAVMASLEVMVVDTTAPMCVRVGAWARLLKIYGVMRTDDLQKILPQE